MTAVLLVVLLTAVPSPVHGTATWYCSSSSNCTSGYGPDDMVAAIDRKDSSYRKGDVVKVSSGGKSIVVRIVDVCACAGSRVIDLTSGAFRRLAPLSRGVIRVTLTPAHRPSLPATDTRDDRYEIAVDPWLAKYDITRKDES